MMTYLKMRTLLENSVDVYSNQHKFYVEMRKLLKKFEGRRVDTKRTISHIQNSHPTWVVSFDRPATQVYIRVWGGDSGFSKYDYSMRVFLGYEGDNLANFNLNEYDEHNNGVEYAATTIAKILELTDNPEEMKKIADEIDAFNRQKEYMENMFDRANNPAFSIIKSLVKF